MNNLTNLLTRAFFMSTPLVLGALGEVIAERTGMMVTAVEGIFLIGAWGGFIGAYISGNIWLGFLIAMFCGLTVAALYALTTVYMNQHQIVMGTAIAILVSGFCTFFYRVIFGIQTTPLKVLVLPNMEIPILSKIPFLGAIIFSQNMITYCTYILVPIVFFIIFKTSLGLTLRSCGENPEAVDAAGLNVRLVRFGAVLVAGCLGGIAGAYYSFGICFLGNWNPLGALIFGIVFGISEAIGIYVKALGLSTIPSELFSALPYILVIILTVCRKELRVPNRLGAKYLKEN